MSRSTLYIVIRHGSNAANQSMTPRLPIGYIEASNRDEAQKLALGRFTCYANQHLEIKPASRASKGDLEAADYGEELQRETDLYNEEIAREFRD